MEQNIFAKVFLLSYLFVISGASPVTSKEEDGELLKKSNEMRSYMNESIDPCDNFYEFVCGNWPNIHPAKDAETETSYLFIIKKAFDEKAIAILTDTSDSTDINTDIDQTVKNFYKSCMKLTDGVQPEKVISVISEFGKMPALSESDWDEEHFDWLETLAKIKHKYGSEIMLGFDILADMRDNSKNRIYIGEVKFELESKSMYLEPVGEDYRASFKSGVAGKLNTLLGIDSDTADSVAEEILQFEIQLAKGMTDNKGDKSMILHLLNTTAEEMHQKYAPTIDIKKFLKIILGEVPTEMIYEYVPEYTLNLKKVVENTEKRIIANYIFYNLIKEFEVNGSEDKEQLSNTCYEKTKGQFAKNIDNMVYRCFDNKAAEEDILRIWDELKNHFRTTLESSPSLNWLTSATRQKAIEKLDALKIQINSYKDWDFKSEFEGLETTEDDYVENLKNIMIADSKRSIAKLDSPITPVDAGETLSVTPANILVENEVKIPVALLQPYFAWASSFPDALKFGITGFLLAHELIHTFDDTGRQFGKHGNLEDWWDQESAKEFNDRKECFEDQYQNYIYGGRPLPRRDDQGENIADNGGLRLAYESYKNARGNGAESNQKATKDEMLGLNYTSDQLFFIGFGQFWCSDIQSDYLKMQTETDEHTPGKFRAIGTVSNLKEFAAVFNCKVGSEMNPSAKCEMY